MQSRFNNFKGFCLTVLLLISLLGFQENSPAAWQLRTDLPGSAGESLVQRQQWQRPIQPSLSGGALVGLALHPLDPSKFLIANSSQLFESSKNFDWKILWSGTGREASIRKILSFEFLPEEIFILTSSKIVMGHLRSDNWETVYDSGNRTEKAPLSFAVDPGNPNHWFVGTSKGLWLSENTGQSWRRSDLLSGSHAVPILLFTGSKLLIGTEQNLFLSISGSLAQSVFELPAKELPSSETIENFSDNLEGAILYASRLFSLIQAGNSPDRLFIGTEKGVFESRDGGYRWEPLPQSGLQNLFAVSLAYDKRNKLLFAATPGGIYQYSPGALSWKALHEGLAGRNAENLTIYHDETLIALTGGEVLSYQIKPEVIFSDNTFTPSSNTLMLLRTLVSREPSAREIQERVIRYADVANGKIKRWHLASRLSALLPSFSFGKDFSTSSSVDLDRGSTNDPDVYIEGPYDRNKGWDADVSWRFGDALYSSAQTSIDSREKLMVELRQDLLSEAMRIYYERRRMQIDLVYTPSFSEQEHLERLIRLDELTSLLDGMTDGFVSKRLAEIYEHNIEFNSLWIFNPTIENRDSASIN